ncbi:MAG: M28 family peptidase [Candidatus Thorarchaeota archaeon]
MLAEWWLKLVKRLFVATFFIAIIVCPVGALRLDKIENPVIVSDTTEPDLERIYGRIVAEELWQNITASEILDIIRKFTENGTRFVSAVGDVEDDQGANKAARLYIIQQLEELTHGRIEIELIGQYANVIGKLPGYLPGDHPAFIVSAHYDSPSGCPGANCDGSGIAVMLTLARVMSQYEWPLDIYFMAFNGLHPHGILWSDFYEGSQEVAGELRHRGFQNLAMFNIDTILHPDPDAPTDQRLLMGFNVYASYTASQYWAELAKTMSDYYGRGEITSVPGIIQIPIWDLADHVPFFNRDFPGVVTAFESGYETDAVYHTGSDVYYNPGYNYGLAKELAATIGACMGYTMGRTFGKPRQINTSIIIENESVETFYIPITTPTNLEVICRWFGGPASFYLRDPNNALIGIAEFDEPSAWEAVKLFDIPVSVEGLYSLSIVTGHEDVGFEMSYTFDTDIDGNGVLDRNEFWLDPVYFVTDLDGDGLSAADELFLGTDDENIDSDGDSMDDKFEVDNGFDPTNPSDGAGDADHDGLTNTAEYLMGLNLFSADSDQDRMDDLWEVENGLRPLFDDSMLDADGDGKTNLQEYLEGTDPQVEEKEDVPVIWLVAPFILIAVIAGFVYVGRDYF